MIPQQITAGELLDHLALAVARAKREGLESAVAWEYHHCMTDRERIAFDLFLVKTHDPLAEQAGSPESRFRKSVRRMLLGSRMSFYCSTFCNFAHWLDTGRPIGHECYVIPPRLLQAERDLPFEDAIEVWRPWYSAKGPIISGRKST